MLPSHVYAQAVLGVEGVKADVALIAARVMLILNMLFQTLFNAGLMLAKPTNKLLGR